MRVLGVDHVILPVADLGEASAPFERLGLALTPAMTHGGGATENRVFFAPAGRAGTAETYVELLAAHAGADPALLSAVARGGLHRIVLTVDDADAARAALAGKGVAASSREARRSDGSLIGTVVDLDAPALGCSVGLIAYAEAAAARVARHRAAGLFDHAIGLRRLDHLAVIVPAPDGLAALEGAWADLLGLAVTGEVRGRGMVIRQVAVGDAIVELIGPDAPDSPVTKRPAGLASVTAFDVADLDATVAAVRDRGFTIADPAPGVLPDSRTAVISADQLAGLTLQLISFH